MKIKRVKTDDQGNPVLDPTTGQPVIEEVEMFTQDEVSARNKKLYDEKKRAEREADDARQARQTLEQQLAERDQKEKERERAQLPPDQQVMARLNDVESKLAQEKAERARIEAESKQSIRRVGLVAYRERALRDVPEEVHHLVFGDSEEAIDASVDHAIKVYEDLQQKLEAKLLAGQGIQGAVALQQQHVHQPHVQQYQTAPYHAGQPVQYVPVQPPANPAYVPPVPQYVAQQGGFPTPTNPLPVPDPSMGPGEIDLNGVTSEQAVRSGRYGGEMRERILSTLKGQAKYPGSLGSTPRHWGSAVPVNHVPQPMGVMQPQGYPTGSVQPAHLHPQTYQQPVPPQMAPMPIPQMPQMPPMAPPQQYTPAPVPHPVPQGAPHKVSAAQAAVDRMHNGQSPIVAGDSTAQAVLHQAHEHARARGISNPQQAFDARFTPTPPIQPGAS